MKQNKLNISVYFLYMDGLLLIIIIKFVHGINKYLKNAIKFMIL
jgi:hypothetical protein